MKASAVSAVLDGAGVISRAQVVLLQEDGSALVRCTDSGDEYTCQVLETAEGQGLRLEAATPVLVWRSSDSRVSGVILGRIGGRHAHPESVAASGTNEHVPHQLVIEAKHSLTLRVGDGSITIREGGKILIKGKDLVSHAKRLNRIRGGAVQIN